jgi:Ca2+-transporting ATPase
MATTTQTPGPAPQPPDKAWYAQSPEDVGGTLGADVAQGLTAAEAASRLQKNGPNALPAEKPKPGWLRFVDEYRSYMQIILLIAGVFSMAIGQFHTGIMVLLLTVINAVVGLREEGKAESAMNALKSMMKATARVRRDGAEAQIPAEQVVAGDTVLLAAGDQVPADGRIVQAAALQIDESALTGESVPASKDAQTLTGDNLGPGDQTDMAFMNTPVTHGSGVMIVTGTGADTEVGKIAGMLSATKAEQTPLTRQLNRMTLWIGAAALVTMIVMFVLGLQRGQEWSALFVTAIALAIAAIPEALPTVSQVILSMGAMDLAKRNAIVKNLSSVETLGSTSAINSDKTGTLTMNQMTVVEVLDLTDQWQITGTGYSLEGTVKHSIGASASIDDAILPFIVANDAKLEDGKVVGDPTEGAMLVLAHKSGLNVDGTREKFPRLATLPFDPTYKLMATFNDTTAEDGKKVVRCFVKGAAPAVGSRSTCVEAGGQCVPVDDDLKQKAQNASQRLGGQGLRVMAAAYRDIDPAEFKADGDLLGYCTDLHLVSIIGMIDPPRAESAAAVKQAQEAHIRVRMVTGDDVVTGAAVAKQIGIPGEAILGTDFAALSEDERLKKIDDIGVVGRVAPEHKVLLAETLKKKGDVVAMTGDGVNDAPAIKAADIGIAMGTGTEVAKNAGRMILSDDNFATIVFAVEQGRKLFDNLNKYIAFVLITLAAFVLTFLGATIFNIMAGEPFTPGQILWINFLVDAPLGVALGFDKETPGLMKRRPRPRNASILTRQMLTMVGLTGLFMAVCLLWLLSVGSEHYGSAVVGTSLAMTAFAAFRIVSCYESRSMTGSAITLASFNSKQLNYIVLFEVILLILVVSFDLLKAWMGTTDLTWSQWGLALAPAGVLFVLWEIGKAIARAAGRRAEGAEAAGPAAPAGPNAAAGPPSAHQGTAA